MGFRDRPRLGRARLAVELLEGLKRLLCDLLGYSPKETAACLEMQALERY